MSDTEMNYFAKFGLDASSLTSGLTGIAVSFDAIMMAAQMAFSEIEKGYATTVGAALSYGEAMEKAAAITGDTTDQMQQLKAAGKSVGVSFDDVTFTMKMMTQRLDDSTTAGKELQAKMEAIGVTTHDVNGKMKSATEIFMNTNAALNKMPDTFSRNQLAMDIYGRNWQSIIKLITEADTAGEAFSSASIISEDQLKKAEVLGDRMGVIQNNVDAVGRNIGMGLLPALDSLEVSLQSMPSLGEGFTGALEVIDNSLKSVIFTVTMAVFGIRELNAAIKDIMSLNTSFSSVKAIAEESQAYVDKMKSGFSETNSIANKLYATSDSIAYAAQVASGGSTGTGGTSGSSGSYSSTGSHVTSEGGRNAIVGHDAAGNAIYSENAFATSTGGTGSYESGRAFVDPLPEGWSMEYGLPHYKDWPVGQWWSIPDFLYKDSPNAYSATWAGMSDLAKSTAGITGGSTDAEEAAYGITSGAGGQTISISIVNNGVETDTEGINASLGKLAALLGASS